MKRFIRTHWEGVVMSLAFVGAFALAGALDKSAHEPQQPAQYASK